MEGLLIGGGGGSIMRSTHCKVGSQPFKYTLLNLMGEVGKQGSYRALNSLNVLES